MLLDADVDSKQNFFAIGVTDEMQATRPLDISDAAATTRLSVSLADPDFFQRVYYDRSAEIVDIRGGLGNDTFISDDSMAAMIVSGDEGADNFLIGRVIKTKTVLIDGQMVDVVDGEDGLTPGVSFNAAFFGGNNDDYFEVNHNVGELELFGEAGDDTFFLKAQLQAKEKPEGGMTSSEVEGGLITAGAGDAQNDIAEDDTDVLIDYVENNRVEIYGGSGFEASVSMSIVARSSRFSATTAPASRLWSRSSPAVSRQRPGRSPSTVASVGSSLPLKPRLRGSRRSIRTLRCAPMSMSLPTSLWVGNSADTFLVFRSSRKRRWRLRPRRR